MPLGSRPDFIHHVVVESCTSFTFDVAFYIIENNWIPSPPPTSPHQKCAQTHGDLASVHFGRALLIDLLWSCADAESLLPPVGLLCSILAKQCQANVSESRQIWTAQTVCWGTVFQHGSRVILQVELAPASKCEQLDLWEQWLSLLGFCYSTSISAWLSIRKEPVWPTGSWLLSTLRGTADNQQKEPLMIILPVLKTVANRFTPQNVTLLFTFLTPIKKL